MITGFTIKHPNAVKAFEFDFSEDIPENDFLGDYTITILDSEGVDVTDDILLGATIDTDKITVEFQAGDDGQNYLVTVQVSLDLATTTPVRIIELRVRSTAV